MPPNNPKPVLYLRDKLSEMMKQTRSAARPVFGAAALLLLASVLTYTVVAGVESRQGQVYRQPPRVSGPEVKVAAEAVTPPSTVPASPPAAGSVQAPQALTAPAQAPKSAPAILAKPEMPLKGETALAFGWQQHPVYKDWRYHNGIDIAGSEGQAVIALWSGEVVDIVRDRITGLTVIVASGEYTASYGALAAAEVQRGASIKAGSRVGAVGRSEGEPYPHLHLSIKKGDKYLDPAEILRRLQNE